jgi:hypothetical protein
MAMRKGLPAKLSLTDADDTRYDFRNLVVCNADGLPRGGVTAPVGTNILTGTATMAVSVGNFSAIARRDNGAILLAHEGASSVMLPDAPVANSRIDLVLARQNDSSSTVSTPDGDDEPIIYVVPGVAGPSPIAPSVPDGSVEIGRVTVSVGNTTTNAAVISQTSTYTAAPGGVVPFRTASELKGWTNAADGQLARDLAGDQVYIFWSSAWRRFGGTPPHAEFTTLVNGLPSQTEYTAHAFANDSAKTNESDFWSLTAGVGIVLKPGIYAISWRTASNVLIGGRGFLSIQASGEVVRSPFGVGEDIASVTIPNLYLVASTTTVSFAAFQTSGGAVNLSGRIRITKIG